MSSKNICVAAAVFCHPRCKATVSRTQDPLERLKTCESTIPDGCRCVLAILVFRTVSTFVAAAAAYYGVPLSDACSNGVLSQRSPR